MAVYVESQKHPNHRAARPANTRGVRRLAVGVIGPGRVGRALLDQLHEAGPRLARDHALNLALCGVAASQRMWLDCDDPALNAREAGSAQTWRPSELGLFAQHVRAAAHHALIIDCSASEAVASRYAGWLGQGIHIVTPNKVAASGPLERWQAIRAAAAQGGRLRYEATVCAGLPVVQTLRDLIDTGDQLASIEGMFSGTLAWLCNRHDGSRPFSSLLREAHALGYTEPDPREDLSGLDVARKLVILAREAGWPLSLEEVQVESLVPDALRGVSLDECMQQLEAFDAPLAARLAQAHAHGGVLRYVAQLDRDGQARVCLAALALSHPFAHTRLTDNVVQFTTRRYCNNPLVVQGPGAGPEVTAAGVFADLLRIADTLEAMP